MPYKYATQNCEHCEYCVKTDKGLYCSHREGHPKVTCDGWCIDMQEKAEKLDNGMIPVGTTVHINPEDIKWEWNDGDLISRSALKKSIKSYADDQYAENEYLGEYAIMDIINNAPAVEVPENAVNCVLTMFGECSYNKTGCSDCEIKDKIHKALSERPQGEWIHLHAIGDYKCSICGCENLYKYANEHERWVKTNSNFCPNCGAKLQIGGAK